MEPGHDSKRSVADIRLSTARSVAVSASRAVAEPGLPDYRGNRRETIFRDGRDREAFLSRLDTACGKTGWEVRAFVLMGNPYHLVLRTPEANLVEGMKWLQSACTRYFNVRHQLWGRVFGGQHGPTGQAL